MPAEFHFLRPEWLWALPAVVGAAVYFAFRRFGPGSWTGLVDPGLAPHVLTGAQGARRDGRWLVFAVAGVLGVVALAGPVWERIAQPVFRSDQSLVVALDLSRSMDAQDVEPSRLMRARLKILELLERRAGGQTALVVYSANAFTVTPLTTDADTIAALVNSLGTDIMPSQGSYPAVAIRKGRELLEQTQAGSGEILLITDGGASPAAEDAATELRTAGFTLSVLGVGTPQGAPIPRTSGGFVTDAAGQMAIPRLEESGLRALAEVGGGRYATLSSNDSDLDHLLSGATTARATGGDEAQATDQWREEGPWLLLAVLPLAALAFRRGWAFCAVFTLLPLARPAEASVWDNLWFNRNQQAERLLEAGEADAAAQTFEDPDWQAVSRYRAGDYAESAARFAEGEGARNLYNLGNALARQGEFESAIDAYDQVLELDPDDSDAVYNRDLVKQALEQQKQQQQQQEQGESQESQSAGEDSQQTESSQDPNEQSDGQSESDRGDDSDAANRPEDESTEQAMRELEEELKRAAEQAEAQEAQPTDEDLMAQRQQQAEQQAMEQWLRRIPNDPGGLLRRKFRYQYQREGRDQDGNSVWPDDEEQPW
jgi:Ca-activated chloride channel family protein